MQAETELEMTSAPNEKVSDLLIAISVVSKRLAEKINENSETKKGVTECTETTTD